MSPMTKIPKQKPNPPTDCPFDSPWTIRLKQVPKTNPPKLPFAKRNPAAVPSPTGKAI